MCVCDRVCVSMWALWLVCMCACVSQQVLSGCPCASVLMNIRLGPACPCFSGLGVTVWPDRVCEYVSLSAFICPVCQRV